MFIWFTVSHLTEYLQRGNVEVNSNLATIFHHGDQAMKIQTVIESIFFSSSINCLTLKSVGFFLIEILLDVFSGVMQSYVNMTWNSELNQSLALSG